jgi:hypothetical protein
MFIDMIVGFDGALWDFLEAVTNHGVNSHEGRIARARLARSYVQLVESSRATPLLRRVAKRLHREWSDAALERCRGFGERYLPEPDAAFDDDSGTRDKPRCRRKM